MCSPLWCNKWNGAYLCPFMPYKHNVRVLQLCRRFEQRLVTNWRQVQLNAVWQRLYSQTDEAMQVRHANPLASAHIHAAMQ